MLLAVVLFEDPGQCHALIPRFIWTYLRISLLTKWRVRSALWQGIECAALRVGSVKW